MVIIICADLGESYKTMVWMLYFTRASSLEAEQGAGVERTAYTDKIIPQFSS